jgi:hypothetical protein
MVNRHDLEIAYRATDYTAQTPWGLLTLRIDERSVPLDRELTARGLVSWAYVTAFNPGSIPASADENEARQQELRSALISDGYAFFEGAGVGSDWTPEPSLLILGIDEATAVTLASRFRQVAIVLGKLGEPARLRWLSGDGADGDPVLRI